MNDKYDDILNFSEGLARVRLNDKWGIIDKAGKEVIPLIYDWVDNFSEGLVEVILNGEVFYINKKGEQVSRLNDETLSGDFNTTYGEIVDAMGGFATALSDFIESRLTGKELEKHKKKNEAIKKKGNKTLNKKRGK